MQISPPQSGIIAFQVGAITGVVSGLLVAGPWWIASGLLVLIMGFLVPIVALLLVGLLAARRTGRASTGTLAGMWAGFIGTVVALALIAIATATVGQAEFMRGMMSNPRINSQNAEQALWIGLTLVAGVLVIVGIGLGAGLGALGSLIGKNMSPLAQRPDPSALAYPQALYRAPQSSYWPSHYPPQQPPLSQFSSYTPLQQPPPSSYEH